MPLSTEIFVMIIFWSGLPFFYVILKGSALPSRAFFFIAYNFLVVSNTCTVVEEFWLNAFFNFCEHSFIALASVTLFAAIFKLAFRKPLTDVGGHKKDGG